jgi:cyclase
MALTIRVIPCLDVADGRVVKGINFENLIDAGDPVVLATRYYNEGADEITFLDVKATLQGRAAMLDVVKRTAEAVFIPLTVGGGIKSVDDVSDLLEAGADKVSVGSAGLERPELLSEISARFGSQVLVVSMDIKIDKQLPSGYTVMSHGGSKETGRDAMAWIIQAQELGCGELLINSIDADGTKSGFDLLLLEVVRKVATVPFIASGGAGSAEDFVPAAATSADALLAASIFHSGSVRIADVKSSLVAAGYLARGAA